MKVGDKARVIGNNSGHIKHYRPLNSTVIIIQDKDKENCYFTASEERPYHQHIHENDLEPIPQQEKQ